MLFSSHCHGSTPACVFIENLLPRRGTLVDRFDRECLPQSASIFNFNRDGLPVEVLLPRVTPYIAFAGQVEDKCTFLTSSHFPATEYLLSHSRTHFSLIGVRMDVLQSGLVAAQRRALHSA